MRRFRPLSIRRRAALHLLVIGLLVGVNVAGVWLFLDDQAHDGNAIDEAGEQRMLTQRMAYEAHMVRMGRSDLRDELAADAAEYDRTLTALIEGNASMGIPPAPPGVRESLLAVRAEWRPFHDRVRTIVTAPPSSPAFEAAVDYVEANNAGLLATSDAAVQRYERAYEGKVSRLRWFLLGVLGLDLVVIPLLFAFIDRGVLRPINWMAGEARAIATGDLDRSISVVDSADEVGELSGSLEEMRQQLVSALRNARRFEQAVEHAGHAIYITDAAETIVYANPAFEAVTKYDREQVVGETPRILQSGQHDEAFYDEMWATLRAGEVWSAETVNRRATGERFHAYQTIAPVTDDDGEIAWVVAVMADNTEQIVSNQQNQVLSRVIRHNLRTELNLIQGYVHELARAPDADERAAFAAKVDERVDKLVTLSATVDRFMRTITREDRRQQELGAVIERTADTMRERYPEATIRADVPDYRIDVLANVELVLEEVVENAIEHNDRPHPAVDIEVTLREADDPPPTVVVEVADDGPGIPIAERRVIEEGEETPLFHGSGLGLWLIHWTVTLAGGEVSIEERSPRGSRVAIALPQASVSPFPRDDGPAGTDGGAETELEGTDG